MPKRQLGRPWRRTRARIMERDGGRCQIAGPRCQRTATEVDHIRPVSQVVLTTRTISELSAVNAISTEQNAEVRVAGFRCLNDCGCNCLNYVLYS